MKKIALAQKILFFALLALLVLIALYAAHGIVVLLWGEVTGFPWYAALVFAHMFAWVPVTGACVILSILCYRRWRRKKELRWFAAAFAVVVAITAIAIAVASYVSDVLFLCAFVLMITGAVVLMARLAQKMGNAW